jgi:hypothetical protein
MKKAIVIGSAPCVHEDVFNAPDWPKIVVNWAGLRHLGPIEFWASIHRRLLYKAIPLRKEAGGTMRFTAFTVVPKGRKLRKVPTPTRITQRKQRMGSGSSGLFAVECALSLGYQRLLLCGIPLEGDTSLQFEDQEEERIRCNQSFVTSFRAAWENHYDELAPHIRSMSGWTRELFGSPEDWI